MHLLIQARLFDELAKQLEALLPTSCCSAHARLSGAFLGSGGLFHCHELARQQSRACRGRLRNAAEALTWPLGPIFLQLRPKTSHGIQKIIFEMGIPRFKTRSHALTKQRRIVPLDLLQRRVLQVAFQPQNLKETS